MRSLAILVLLAFATPALAEDRVDWSEYIETKSSKPVVIKHETTAPKKVASKPARSQPRKVVKRTKIARRKTRR